LTLISHDRPVKCALAAFGLAVFFGAPAQADLAVFFEEGAPKDRFTLENVGDCAVTSASLLLDLSESQGKLIFDVSGEGAGVEVFQPLELVAGADVLSAIPVVEDGDEWMTMDVVDLQPGEVIAFTIDLDDTVGSREITVSNDEILGTKFRLTQGGQTSSLTFTAIPQGLLKTVDC